MAVKLNNKILAHRILDIDEDVKVSIGAQEEIHRQAVGNGQYGSLVPDPQNPQEQAFQFHPHIKICDIMDDGFGEVWRTGTCIVIGKELLNQTGIPEDMDSDEQERFNSKVFRFMTASINYEEIREDQDPTSGSEYDVKKDSDVGRESTSSSAINTDNNRVETSLSAGIGDNTDNGVEKSSSAGIGDNTDNGVEKSSSAGIGDIDTSNNNRSRKRKHEDEEDDNEYVEPFKRRKLNNNGKQLSQDSSKPSDKSASIEDEEDDDMADNEMESSAGIGNNADNGVESGSSGDIGDIVKSNNNRSRKRKRGEQDDDDDYEPMSKRRKLNIEKEISEEDGHTSDKSGSTEEEKRDKESSGDSMSMKDDKGLLKDAEEFRQYPEDESQISKCNGVVVDQNGKFSAHFGLYNDKLTEDCYEGWEPVDAGVKDKHGEAISYSDDIKRLVINYVDYWHSLL